MRIEFDPGKDAANREKHGLSLQLAVELDWESALVWLDEREDYGEMRMIALAPKTAILYYVAFVDRFPLVVVPTASRLSNDLRASVTSRAGTTRFTLAP